MDPLVITLFAVVIRVAPKAEKDLRRVGAGTNLDRIGQALNAIDAGAADPNTVAKRMTGTDVPIWSTRVGDYRILWTFDSEGPLVFRVVHRSDLDQALKRI